MHERSYRHLHVKNVGLNYCEVLGSSYMFCTHWHLALNVVSKHLVAKSDDSKNITQRDEGTY